jgi:DNA-binding NarL/FixJ family response regulator
MSAVNNILIVDDDPVLRKQLKRMIQSVIPSWHILEADTYCRAIEMIQYNKFNILVCDLFLSSNESDITRTDYTPEGILVAKEARKINPRLFTIIVTSNLESFVYNHKILDYIDAGINAFFDRSTNPYEKFVKTFEYQLRIIDKSTIFSDNLVSRLWQTQSIECCSYWIFIGDRDESNCRDLIGDILIWAKTLFLPEASVLLMRLDDVNFSYLIENEIISDINDYPILIISQTSNMLENIKIGSQSLKIIKENNTLTNFLNIVHAQLRYKSISQIKKNMQLPNYWVWAHIPNIIGFSHETGSIELRPEKEKNNIIGDTYNVKQAGSVGKHSRSNDNTFTD